jgi:precorrin-6Y C5,15-methyltransferase (decarboxylating)
LKKLHVIGIGFRPLDQEARRILLMADHIMVNERLKEVFRRYDEYRHVKDRVRIINNVDETMEFIRAEVQKSGSEAEDKNSRASALPSFHPIVLIAEGDPMFFGIGRRVVQEFGRENVEIFPDLSSIQVAFSRIKEPWGDAFLISLHGGPDPHKRRKLEYEPEDIPMLLKRHHKLGILTDRVNTPSKIASLIQSSIVNGQSSIRMFVCERLGYPDERITEGSPEEIKDRSFTTPNVVVILRRD